MYAIGPRVVVVPPMSSGSSITPAYWSGLFHGFENASATSSTAVLISLSLLHFHATYVSHEPMPIITHDYMLILPYYNSIELRPAGSMAETLQLIARDASRTSSDGNLHAAVFGTSITCIVLVSAFTSARLLAKSAISRFNVEDYLSMVTWLLLVGYTVTLMISANYGTGNHIQNVPSGHLTEMLKTYYAIDIFYSLTTGCAKTALLFQMQRIFCPVRSGFVYISCYVLSATVVTLYSVVTLVLILQCIPIRKVWDPSITSGHCTSEDAISAATGVINVVMDFTILVLPIVAIFRLEMPLKKKYTTSAIFATGLLACACSLCRMIYAFEMTDGLDYTYKIAKLGITAACEITSIVLCTCFPLIPRFLQICRKSSQINRLLSVITRRAMPTSSKNQAGSRFNANACPFCDGDSFCAAHAKSNNTEMSHHKAGPAINRAVFDPDTPWRRDSDETEVGDGNGDEDEHHKSTDITAQRRSEVQQGAQLEDDPSSHSTGI